MENDNFTPEQSLRVIEHMISKSRRKYEENGLTILVWGLLVAFAGILQGVLVLNQQYEHSYLAWVFTMIPGFIITWIAKFIKAKKEYDSKQRNTTDINGLVWAFAGICAMLSGFVFNGRFGSGFIPMLMIPFCVAALSEGLQTKVYSLVIGAIITAVISYISFYVDNVFHPFLISACAICLMIIPGIQLHNSYKKAV